MIGLFQSSPKKTLSSKDMNRPFGKWKMVLKLRKNLSLIEYATSNIFSPNNFKKLCKKMNKNSSNKRQKSQRRKSNVIFIEMTYTL